jgi:hypothetical protein
MESENVKFIRLVTGEDIITEVVETKSNNKIDYTIINPLKVVYMVSNKPGMLSISLMNWIFSHICENQSFSLKPTDILLVGNPTEEIIEYYYNFLDKVDQTEEENSYIDEINEMMQDSKKRLLN